MTRLRRLIATALADSFGLSLGWTVFSLHVVRGHGLAGLGLCNAAMLVGVALSAPVAARLSARLDGRALLRVTCVTEAALRVGTFVLLLTGVPLAVVAAAVAASNVVAWTGYAGMRAEVAAADPRGVAMTWYMVTVAAIEAAGTATAALLPTAPTGLVSGGLLVAVIACYGGVLIPTWLVAAGARVPRAQPVVRPTPPQPPTPRPVAPATRPGAPATWPGAPATRPGAAATRPGAPTTRPGAPAIPADLRRVPRWGSVALRRKERRRISTAPYRSGPLTGLLTSGGLVMLLGSGPTLLAVGLAAELHGTRWVAGSALAFAGGSLLAPFAVARLERHAVPPSIAWPALGVGMAAGWTFAAWHPLALLAAQLLSGMCMSALEGDMDARIAASNAAPGGVTAGLASAAALRAFGSAAAVALVPRVIAETGIGWLGAALATGLATLALSRLAHRWSRSAAGRVVGVAAARDV
jgi:hypothetical protein